ncbi:MAG TPA: hypothetical protein VJ476_04045 [Rhizomicrobium sp.]|nr:hypothetical protein [Rhizomicrobium sp.]
MELDDVVEAIKKRGVKDDIWYFKADLDPSVVQAALVEWEHPDGAGGVKHVAHIDYAKALPPDRQRLAVCKELLHLLDPPEMKVSTEEEFEKLVSRIGLPPEDQDPALDGHKTISDRVGIYKAVAVLFPWAAREVFLPKFKDGTISHEDIARVVDIPPRYAALVMQDWWAQMHEILVKDRDA